MCEDARKTFESTECVISRLPAAPATRPHSYHASRVAPGSRGDFGLSFLVLPAVPSCSRLLSAAPGCSRSGLLPRAPGRSRLRLIPTAPGCSRRFPAAPDCSRPSGSRLPAAPSGVGVRLVSGWCPVGVWVRCSRIPAAPATVPHLTARADRACREQARPLPAAPNRSRLLPPPTPHLSRASAAAAGCSRRPLTLDGPG